MTKRTPATIIGWSREGSISDLSRTISAKLAPQSRLEVTTYQSTVLISGEDPIRVARRTSRLPGTSWVAVGYEFRGLNGCLDALRVLASHYLRDGDTFSISANVSGSEVEEGDVILDSNSAILKEVHGSHVQEARPAIRFRIEMRNDVGVCGVELRTGPGGVPTSRQIRASCLVSGGYHSAAMAWLAVLSGYSVAMIHSRETGAGSEESLRQVARLYAEISSRADPSELSLVLLQGKGEAADRLEGWFRNRRPDAAGEGIVLAGVHPQCRGDSVARAFGGNRGVAFPLLLFQEGDILARTEELGVKLKPEDESTRLTYARRKSSANPYTYKVFGGVEADQTEVLDSLMAEALP